MRGIFLGAGSNLGDRKRNLEDARRLLSLNIVRSSSLYETEPVDFRNQPWFLNAVWEIETELGPMELLYLCQSVEEKLHRVRAIAKGPRTIDLDILFYGSRILKEPSLTIPHPGIANRRFVLVPLVEIARDFVHPVLQRTAKELLESCTDNSEVRLLNQ